MIKDSEVKNLFPRHIDLEEVRLVIIYDVVIVYTQHIYNDYRGALFICTKNTTRMLNSLAIFQMGTLGAGVG